MAGGVTSRARSTEVLNALTEEKSVFSFLFIDYVLHLVKSLVAYL